jgi:hypothetical protein
LKITNKVLLIIDQFFVGLNFTPLSKNPAAEHQASAAGFVFVVLSEK